MSCWFLKDDLYTSADAQSSTYVLLIAFWILFTFFIFPNWILYSSVKLKYWNCLGYEIYNCFCLLQNLWTNIWNQERIKMFVSVRVALSDHISPTLINKGYQLSLRLRCVFQYYRIIIKNCSTWGFQCIQRNLASFGQVVAKTKPFFLISVYLNIHFEFHTLDNTSSFGKSVCITFPMSLNIPNIPTNILLSSWALVKCINQTWCRIFSTCNNWRCRNYKVF